MPARGNLGRWGLRTFALGYLAVLLLIPFGTIFYRAFEHGLATAFTSVTHPGCYSCLLPDHPDCRDRRGRQHDLRSRMRLALVRTNFRGKALLNAVVDLPFAISPVVVGLSLLSPLRAHRLVRRASCSITASRSSSLCREWSWRRSSSRCRSWSARWCRCCTRSATSRSRRRDARRQLVADLLAGDPAGDPLGVAYGVVLTTARALGEFGAVAVVSGGSATRPRPRRSGSGRSSGSSTRPGPTRPRWSWR